ncbi:MAG: hypothetical protein KKH99_14595 [Proteobacteria bacterium]|nr:hypothetical protein [Pseudomonadota bacterium]
MAKQSSPSEKEEKQPLYGFKLESTPKEFAEKNNNDSLILKPGIIKSYDRKWRLAQNNTL